MLTRFETITHLRKFRWTTIEEMRKYEETLFKENYELENENDRLRNLSRLME